jgi:hypothetical protein
MPSRPSCRLPEHDVAGLVQAQARERGLAGLERLARDGKLAPAQQGWLEDITASPDCRLSRPICGKIVSIGRLPQTVPSRLLKI